MKVTIRRTGLSDAARCRQNGWIVGTQLIGDQGYGPTVIELTAIGERCVLAREISHNGEPVERYERAWALDYRDWKPVTI